MILLAIIFTVLIAAGEWVWNVFIPHILPIAIIVYLVAYILVKVYQNRQWEKGRDK